MTTNANTNNTTATATNTANTTATNTTNVNANLQRRVNNAAIEGVQRLLDVSGKIAADGHLKMAVIIKLVIKASEEESVVARGDKGDRNSHAEADVTLDVRADIDGSLSATADGDCHGERY